MTPKIFRREVVAFRHVGPTRALIACKLTFNPGLPILTAIASPIFDTDVEIPRTLIDTAASSWNKPLGDHGLRAWAVTVGPMAFLRVETRQHLLDLHLSQARRFHNETLETSPLAADADWIDSLLGATPDAQDKAMAELRSQIRCPYCRQPMRSALAGCLNAECIGLEIGEDARFDRNADVTGD